MFQRYPEVKCPKCGRVHVAIPVEVARQYASNDDEALARYFKCIRFDAPTHDFLQSQPGDVPVSATLHAEVLLGLAS
jgi:phage FluMu protein Com